jgi:hypothetical protein
VESAVRETPQGKGSSLDQLRPLACAGRTHPRSAGECRAVNCRKRSRSQGHDGVSLNLPLKAFARRLKSPRSVAGGRIDAARIKS